MLKLKASIRRFLPVLIGCVAVFAASSAFAQNGDGTLGNLLNTYQSATTQWMGDLMVYATDLFAALAAIEFAWTAIILVMEQRELEGWVATFIKKLMGISFFYALLLKGPSWIPAIIDSLSQIGQNVGQTKGLTADTILGLGVQLGGQILQAAANLLNGINALNAVTYIYKIPWVELLGAIATVVVLCYVAIAIQFLMAQVEGFIVISAGMIYLGFGGSRWTSSYVERFLGTAVSTGIRLMVFYLIIGLGKTLTQGPWTQTAQKIANEVNHLDFIHAAGDAFTLGASIIIFTVLAFRLPKLVGAVISGSPSLSGGDLAGTVGTIVGGAATAASLVAAPELLAAKAGATAGSAGAEGAMSAGKAADAGAGSMKGAGGGGPMDFAGKGGSGQAQPPGASANKNASNGSGAAGSNASSQAQPPGASSSKAASSASSSNVSGTPGSNAKSQAQPPSVSASSGSISPSRATAGNGASVGGNGAGVGGSRMGSQAPSTFSPSSGGVSSGTIGGTDATPPSASASADGAASFTSPPASAPESIGSPISAGAAAPPPGTYDSPSPQPPAGGPQGQPPELSPVAKGAQMVSNGLNHLAGGLHSLENDGGGAPVSVPPPTEGSLRD